MNVGGIVKQLNMKTKTEINEFLSSLPISKQSRINKTRIICKEELKETSKINDQIDNLLSNDDFDDFELSKLENKLLDIESKYYYKHIIKQLNK